MLMSLPRAKDQIYKTELLKGLYLPEEIDPMHTIPFRLEIIVNKNDGNALSLAEEIREVNEINVQISSCEDLRHDDAINIEEGVFSQSDEDCRSFKLSRGRFTEVNNMMHVILDEETNLDRETENSSKVDGPIEAVNVNDTALTERFNKKDRKIVGKTNPQCPSLATDFDEEPFLKKEEELLEEGACCSLRLPSDIFSAIDEEIFDNTIGMESNLEPRCFSNLCEAVGKSTELEKATNLERQSFNMESDQEPLLKEEEELLPSDSFRARDVTRSYSNFTIPRVFLLYLNKETFNDEYRALMTESIHEAKKKKIPIILVHEQDLTKEASPDFSYFFQHTPQELLDSPINLYSDIAIPVYTRKEYRQISLHFIVEKINSSMYTDEEEKNRVCWNEICLGKGAYAYEHISS